MKLLTVARDLKRRKGRERQHQFVAEGVRAVEELLKSSLRVAALIVSPSGVASERCMAITEVATTRKIPVLHVSEEDFVSASDTDNPQGVLAIASIPEWNLPTSLPDKMRLVILDALQDPGNVGTVIRTATALGVTATIALPGTVDLWNAKVVRASMGALFHHPTMTMSWQECQQKLSESSTVLFAADAKGRSVSHLSAIPERIALVVSNEGAGLSSNLSSQITERVSIPMSAEVESLNVGVATGILLFALGELHKRAPAN